MKSTLIAIMSLTFSFSAFALESGNYTNNAYTSEQAPLYKSLQVDTSKCEKGGAIVKFYGADSFNFCVGNVQESVFKTTKCLGKELPYPFGGCVGIKKKMVLKTIKKTVVDEATASISLVETSLTDDTVTFTQTYKLTEEGGDIRVNYSFSDKRDGRKGTESMLFERAN